MPKGAIAMRAPWSWWWRNW